MTDRPPILRTMFRTVRAMRAELERALVEIGLHVGQHQILRALYERDGLTPREIATRNTVEMPTITRAVQRMERTGFVRRESNPGDARSVRIFLTDKGHAVKSDLDRIVERQTQRVLRGFSPEERDALARAFERMGANLLEMEPR